MTPHETAWIVEAIVYTASTAIAVALILYPVFEDQILWVIKKLKAGTGLTVYQ